MDPDDTYCRYKLQSEKCSLLLTWKLVLRIQAPDWETGLVKHGIVLCSNVN